MPPIGFIQDDLDLKLLVLYIMDRAAGPITFLQLFELALCDAGVDYFSLAQAVDHMVATGQLTKEEDRYAALRRESQVRARIMDREDGTATLCLSLEDDSSPLLHLALLSPGREQAERWAEAFQSDPSALYMNVIKLLDKEDTNET